MGEWPRPHFRIKKSVKMISQPTKQWLVSRKIITVSVAHVAQMLMDKTHPGNNNLILIWYRFHSWLAIPYWIYGMRVSGSQKPLPTTSDFVVAEARGPCFSIVWRDIIKTYSMFPFWIKAMWLCVWFDFQVVQAIKTTILQCEMWTLDTSLHFWVILCCLVHHASAFYRAHWLTKDTLHV